MNFNTNHHSSHLLYNQISTPTLNFSFFYRKSLKSGRKESKQTKYRFEIATISSLGGVGHA